MTGGLFLCKIELHILLPKKFKITCDFLDPKLVPPFLVSKFKIDFKKKYSYSRGTTQIQKNEIFYQEENYIFILSHWINFFY